MPTSSEQRPDRQPDFSQLLKVLRRERPNRPTLFEFFLNDRLYERLAGAPRPIEPTGTSTDGLDGYRRDHVAWLVDAFAAAGYDYVTLTTSELFPEFNFRTTAHKKERTHSINEGAPISDEESYERFPWPSEDLIDQSALDPVAEVVPDGMKAILAGPMGILENLIELLGFDTLCYWSIDEAGLLKKIADRIGSLLFEYYRRTVTHPVVGALIANDDWGFKTQTMIAPSDLRSYVFPWYRKIVEVAHDAGKPVILHSCGQLSEVMDDIIEDVGLDGKHSYEDAIFPVEDAYEEWGSRIAILGGIDVNFLCTATPEAIRHRARVMLERSVRRGGYALGSGNSIPDYVPDEAYFAMTSAVLAP